MYGIFSYWRTNTNDVMSSIRRREWAQIIKSRRHILLGIIQRRWKINPASSTNAYNNADIRFCTLQNFQGHIQPMVGPEVLISGISTTPIAMVMPRPSRLMVLTLTRLWRLQERFLLAVFFEQVKSWPYLDRSLLPPHWVMAEVTTSVTEMLLDLL